MNILNKDISILTKTTDELKENNYVLFEKEGSQFDLIFEGNLIGKMTLSKAERLTSAEVSVGVNQYHFSAKQKYWKTDYLINDQSRGNQINFTSNLVVPGGKMILNGTSYKLDASGGGPYQYKWWQWKDNSGANRRFAVRHDLKTPTGIRFVKADEVSACSDVALLIFFAIYFEKNL